MRTFDANDAASIEESQGCFTDAVWQYLAYIQSNFGNLSQSITKLEKQGLPINEALEIFANVRNEMDTAMGEKADRMPPKKSREAWLGDWISRINGNSVYTIHSRKNVKGIYCEACQQQVFKIHIMTLIRKQRVAVDEYKQLKQNNDTSTSRETAK